MVVDNRKWRSGRVSINGKGYDALSYPIRGLLFIAHQALLKSNDKCICCSILDRGREEPAVKWRRWVNCFSIGTTVRTVGTATHLHALSLISLTCEIKIAQAAMTAGRRHVCLLLAVAGMTGGKGYQFLCTEIALHRAEGHSYGAVSIDVCWETQDSTTHVLFTLVLCI